jgi:hypothetical protein
MRVPSPGGAGPLAVASIGVQVANDTHCDRDAFEGCAIDTKASSLPPISVRAALLRSCFLPTLLIASSASTVTIAWTLRLQSRKRLRREAMRRSLVVVAAVIGFAAAASAATLTVVSSKPTYNLAETISLTIVGDAQGASASQIFGRLQYTGSGSVTPITQTQKQVGSSWSTAPLNNGAGFSDSFNQTAPPSGAQANNLPANNPFSIVTLIANSVGTVNVTWNTNMASGFQLSFFGLTNAPGTSFCIATLEGGCPPVPEPSTGLLLLAGLLGLAQWRRVSA